MARKPLSPRFGRGICYALLAVFALLLLFSATAPQVAAVIENDAIADARVDELASTTNYGSDDFAYVGAGSTPQGERTWLRFDLSFIPGGTTIDSAMLYVYFYGNYSGGAEGGIGVHFSDNDNWFENTVTWDNQPSFESTASDNIAQFTDVGWKTWNVTENVQSQFTTDNLLSLVLKGDNEDVQGYNSLRTREYADSSLHPYLVINQFVIVAINVDDSLIDRDLDYFASGAETDTVITIRVEDKDGREGISAVYIWIRDNDDSVVVDNVQVTDNTIIDDNTLDFVYTYNPADNLSDSALGAFDVNVLAVDIGGENDSNDWGEDGASLFTVDDMQTSIDFNPASPYFGQDLTTSGTVSRVSGSASTDNAWLIDGAHGTFSLGSGNSWSETFAIAAADPGENVGVTVHIKDLPLDGAENSSYLVNSNMRYQIEVRQENDYQLVPGVPIENRPMVIEFKWEGGTQENTLTSNPENIIVPTGGEIPFIASLTDNDEYWRRRVPGSGTGTLVFILPEENATINQYTMSITDYTDSFDTPDGWVSIRAYIDNTLAVINDDWWDATNRSFAYLVLHRYYDGVYLFNRTGAQRNIGHLQAESDLSLDPFVISALEFGENKTFRWEAIEFESSRGDNGEVVVGFRDTHDNTDSVNLEIYTLTDEWRYQAEFAYPTEFESSWTGADNDNSYKIKLEIASREFGSWDEWMIVGPIIAPLPLPTPESGGGLGATIPIAGVAGVFIVAIVAMSFTEKHASTGTLAIAFTAIFLKFISVKVGADLMPVPSSVLILLLFLAIAWKAGEKL